MPPSPKILVILTSHAFAGSQPSGVWLEEFTTPYYVFADAGAQVEVASIAGGAVPIDPNSMKAAGKNPASVERYLQDEGLRTRLSHSKKLDDVRAADYDAVFMPGGHGTMWDLPTSSGLARQLSNAWGEGRIVAAVCHGPAGLVNVQDEKGQPLLAGRWVAAFSNTEEVAAGMDKIVPFALETRIRSLGARYESGPDFKPFAVRDGHLITGQNPASSEKVAELVLQALHERPAK